MTVSDLRQLQRELLPLADKIQGLYPRDQIRAAIEAGTYTALMQASGCIELQNQAVAGSSTTSSTGEAGSTDNENAQLFKRLEEGLKEMTMIALRLLEA